MTSFATDLLNHFKKIYELFERILRRKETWTSVYYHEAGLRSRVHIIHICKQPRRCHFSFLQELRNFLDYKKTYINKSVQIRSATSQDPWSISFTNLRDYTTYKTSEQYTRAQGWTSLNLWSAE